MPEGTAHLEIPLRQSDRLGLSLCDFVQIVIDPSSNVWALIA
ncbi:hypothetical protein BTE28158_02028 [Burkholderia territorii]|nr:hypothetical protein BTE28158_02028 [Burkholderia territorii]